MNKILVVDDDPYIREIVSFALKKAGFEVLLAEDGKKAFESYKLNNPDLIILDIDLPEMWGTEVLARIRGESNVPVILLTGMDDEYDRIDGLEKGGDDYITKPFSPRELVARVKAVLRRGGGAPPPTPPGIQQKGKLKLDHDRLKAYWEDKEIELTVTEFRMLAALMSFPGKVYSRNELMELAYSDGSVVYDRTIDTHIKRIRKKFNEAGGDPIKTVHGAGYRVSEE